MDDNYINDGKSIAWLSYLGLLVIIPILIQKDNPYTKFHIKQGIALLIAYIVWNIVWIIPFFGYFLGIIGWLVLLIFTVWGIINALSGKEEPLPFLDKIAQKINF